jgi:hypothetical protein
MDCTFQFEGSGDEIRCELEWPPAKGWRVRMENNQYWEIAEIELNNLDDNKKPLVYVFCKKAEQSLIQGHFDQMK